MRRLFGRLVFPGALATAMLFTSCATPDSKMAAQLPISEYETAEQIKAMPHCKATVEEHHSCYSVFKTADGKEFSIGSPAATQEVVQFLQTLKVGQTYHFPAIFLDYQRHAK